MPYFKIDNDIFSLRLNSYEFQVYAYLVSCAGKKGECWPSTNTIARALGMSQSTVIGKIDSLVRRQLIDNKTPSQAENGLTGHRKPCRNRQSHESHPDSPLLFPSPKTGGYLDPPAVARKLKTLLKRAGMDEIRFHDLPHTFATLSLQNGVDIKTLSHMLGSMRAN